ncbi:ricin B lectin domain-containing protein [Roridomyces roridus]|uniref:Ricin B lectin domain-containing protein n=1 Tax=Roridomyces roridus TaxID=1738132 RepID=A0AAD7CCM2_9AGAR|nr:ricin B lectin domain-containing protein [Roridomyces roridus]
MSLSLPSLVFAALYLSLQVQAQVPRPGQSLTFDTGLPTGPVGGCLTASSNADGAPVIISSCLAGEAATASNTWVATAGVGKVGTLQIFGDKCLDVTNGVDADGTKLQIWTCGSGNPNQQWVSAGQGGQGTPQIVWAGNNKCVDVTNGNVTQGNVMQVWDCDSSNTNQNWGIAVVNQPKSVAFTLAADTSLCLATSANSTSAPITVETCSSSPAQNWLGFDVGSIPSAQNRALCISTAGDATSPGTKLILNECSEVAARSWSVDWPAQRLENVAASNMCIDLTDGKQTAGTQLQIWNCTDGNTNQNWIADFQF